MMKCRVSPCFHLTGLFVSPASALRPQSETCVSESWYHGFSWKLSWACAAELSNMAASTTGSLTHKDGIIRPIAAQHALLHVHQRHIIMEHADGTEQAQGGDFFDGLGAVVLAQRGYDLALDVLDDVRIV